MEKKRLASFRFNYSTSRGAPFSGEMCIRDSSVTAGEGHNSTAKALKTELESLDSYCSIVDTFDYVSPELAKIISEGYLLVTEKAKYAYKVGYSLAEKRKPNEKSLNLFKYAMSDELARFIN